MENCCNITLSNTGSPSVKCIESEAKKLLFIPRFTNAGVRTNIDLTDVLNEQYFIDWVKDADKSARIYPTPVLENVEDVRAEPIRQEFDSGYNPIVRKGTRSFTGHIINQGAAYLKKLQALACGTVDVYIVTKDSQLLGNGNDVGFLKPFMIAESTLNFELVKRTPSEVAMIQVTFDFDEREKDGDIAFIPKSQLGGYDLLDLNGLLDVYAAAATNISTTGFRQKFFTQFGSVIGGTPIQGLAIADFALAEITPTPGAITITTLTEVNKGEYAFTFATQTSADVLQATVTATGFETGNIPTVTIP